MTTTFLAGGDANGPARADCRRPDTRGDATKNEPARTCSTPSPAVPATARGDGAALLRRPVEATPPPHSAARPAREEPHARALARLRAEPRWPTSCTEVCRRESEEQGSRLAGETTPEPPREIEVATSPRGSRARPALAPVLAAACLVALVAGLVLALRGGGSTNPPSRPTPTGGSRTRPHNRPGRPARPCRRLARSGCGTAPNWARCASRPGRWPRSAGTCTARSSTRRARSSSRLDPNTGAVLARSAAMAQQAYGPPVAAGGLMWFQGNASTHLLGLDP